MDENSSICIKINSWLRSIGHRQHFFLSSIHIGQHLISWFFEWGSASTPFYHRFHTDQNLISWFSSFFFRGLRQHSFLSSAHTGQNLIGWPLRCNETSVSIFVNRSIGHKFWSYENFSMIFISKNIFICFFSWIEFEFYFNSFYQLNE